MAYLIPELFEIEESTKSDLKALMNNFISPVIPEELMLWRDRESIKDFPQMAYLIRTFVSGIKPFMERKIQKQ